MKVKEVEKQVIKRDGRKVNYDVNRIIVAIVKAFKETRKDFIENRIQYEKDINHIVFYVEENLKKKKIYTVEEIQDVVERTLMKSKYKDVAKAYIVYRNNRTLARGSITDKDVMELLGNKSEYWTSENSNKDSKVVTVQRDYLAGITSTDIARRFLLPPEVCKAHDEGIIHQHDMDYMAQKALHNCCLCNLEDMLNFGTVINGVAIDAQKRLSTAVTVATQIITAVSSSQYGGITITLTHLAPFVRKSYEIYYDKYKKRGFNEEDTIKWAEEDLKKEIKDSVQTFNYQINSMSTTNGQAPFLTVYMYINEDKEYEKETALLIEEFLKQRIKGMKNEKGVYITPAFPKLIYVLDENNIEENSPYWNLTVLAAKCTAKRMVPDYISAKKMREYKNAVYACMGCRSFLTPDRTTENYSKCNNWEKGNKYYGRFNAGVTTINLADLALSSGGDFNKFWELFEERTELCHLGLKARLKRLEQVTSDVAPILWQNGALARLNKEEGLYDLLHHGYCTVSLGYGALYECVKYMTGHSHTDGAEGEKFGLEVMQKLNDKCAQWKAAEDIDYSVYGTPLESGTYKFAKSLKKRFGEDIFIKLDGKDRDYVTNSYHVPVFEHIDPFTKLAIESKFQKLSPGGAISYIETADLTGNIDAVLTVMRFIYDNIMYAELNTKSDYCHECGYDGEMKINSNNMTWYCPNCGNTNQDKMNIARRTCGYIGTHYWNYGRTEEIRDRFVHLGDNEN
ncbi:anaerobic ribonucleoside-triphosphate reductase [Enterocloster phage CB473P2]|nr:anaerobic ribonucleoside-triphosphate reductase [Enterocloster phage CB457P2]WAX11476.1 anaerobic ribonucleoside-triphosphate reductase [Enterocloster phage CB473P2]